MTTEAAVNVIEPKTETVTPELMVIEQVVLLPMLLVPFLLPNVVLEEYVIVLLQFPQVPPGKKTSPPLQAAQDEAIVAPFVHPTILLSACAAPVPPRSVQPESATHSVPPNCGTG
jgi:hypothetical protein